MTIEVDLDDNGDNDDGEATGIEAPQDTDAGRAHGAA